MFPVNLQADVVIIGGGIAGLSAALHLAERGLVPLVLEADEESLGGRLKGNKTIKVNGHTFRLEHGVHGIPTDPLQGHQGGLSHTGFNSSLPPGKPIVR